MPDPTSPSDAEFTLLLWKHYEKLLAYVNSQNLPAKVTAEDILQVAYTAAWQRMETLENKDQPEAVFAWLKAIALNKLRDAIKKANTKKVGGDYQQAPNVAQTPSGSMNDLLDMLSDDGSTASSHAARREAIEDVLLALRSLMPQHRQVIELRYFEQLNWAAIAEKTERSEGAAQMLLKRALEKLRELLGSTSKYFSH